MYRQSKSLGPQLSGTYSCVFLEPNCSGPPSHTQTYGNKTSMVQLIQHRTSPATPHGPRSIFPHRNIYNLHPYTELFRSHHCKPVRPSPCARLLSGSPIIEIGDLWFHDPLAMMSVDFAALKT